MMNEDDIRGLNCDFNYNNYGIFYEKLEEDSGKQLDEDQQEDEAAEKVASKNLVGFTKIISDENLLSKMWQKV